MGAAHQSARRLVGTAPEPAAPVAELETEGPAAPAPLGAMVVGHAEDRAEADADRRADVALARLSRRSDTAGDVAGGAEADQHQHGPGCDHVRRSAGPSPDAVVGREGGALDESTSSRISSRRGSGSALPEGVRGRMETAFGTSLSGVRIHTDDSAAQLNRQISARAFTTGKDVFFGQGEFAPDTPEGERVLAHELAHTQQPAEAIQRITFPWDSQETKDKKKDEKAKAEALKSALKAAKLLEKDESARLKMERKQGTAARNELKGKASQELDQMREKTKGDPVQDPSKGPVTFAKTGSGATLDSLQARFAQALEKEKAQVATLVGQGHEAEAAAEAVYQTIWLDTDDKELRAVRPPRETASERLASSVREARSQENSEVKRGELLSPELEKVYEAWEVKTLELMAGPPMKVRAEADVEAGTAVWLLAGAELKGKRPTDAGLERLARSTAKVRTANGLKPSADVTSFLAGEKKSTMEKAEEGGETAEKFMGYGETGLGVVEKGLGKIGGKLDDKLQKGLTKQFEGSDATKVPVAGEFIESVEKVKFAKKKGIRDTDDFTDKDTTGKDLPTSTVTKASEGIGNVTSIFSDLISGANNAIKMVKAIKEANAERSTAKILAATKACADAGKSVATLGKDTATLAKFIDDGVAKSVGSVIPGFNIAIAVMSVVSNSMDLATTGIALSNNNDSLTDARLRSNKKVDVMVAPLLHTTSAATKKFEQAVWSTGQAVSSLVTSIATVASAGGFGIPAAVDSGMKLLDLLHKVGHFIAENVLAVLAQRSREASAGALEGAAEGQLRADPSMAIDGIAMQARKKDAVAIKFLAAYGFAEADIPTTPLGEIREKVLAELGEEADPKTAYQSYKSKIGGMLDKWQETGSLAEQRNGEDAKGRGVFWRIKMSLRSDDKHARSKNKTSKLAGYVECKVGGLVLYADATTEEKQAFVDGLASLDLQTILTASKDQKNSVDWRARLNEIYKDELAKGLTKKVKVGA